MQLFYCPSIGEGETFLSPEESRHCAKSLRMHAGETIHLTDGKGSLYQGELTELNPKKCSFRIRSKSEVKRPGYYLHIAISPTKNTDRIEWFIEKSVEIGIDKISFIQAEHSERKTVNIERVRKKAVSAMKQSIRAYLPEINPLEKLSSVIENSMEDEKIVAHLEGNETKHLFDLSSPSKSYLILIGPEGGFSDREISLARQHGFLIAKLGDYRLRTETAGIVACSTINNLQRRS